MIVFEWLTNSRKYGAHSVDGGHLTIEWSEEQRNDVPWLRLQWRESNGPPVLQACKPSLGSDLIRGFAARELEGKVQMSFPREGALHVLEFPLVSLS